MQKILIAEDNKASFIYLSEVINETGAEIVHARTGKEALEICKRDPEIDLVFMDVKMPIMDGREATKEIKSIRPDLPVIAQTAYALNDEKASIIKDGFDAYMSKPLQRDEILSVLKKFSK
jgi:CheY-like chemotaxis protein